MSMRVIIIFIAWSIPPESNGVTCITVGEGSVIDGPAARNDATRREPAPDEAAAVPARRVRSDTLFAEADLVEIEHGASIYRLRRTRSGKLIMTK